MFIPISAVLFFTETVFWWSWSWSWNSGLDYKTANFTTASCGSSATARLSYTGLSDRSNAEIAHSIGLYANFDGRDAKSR